MKKIYTYEHIIFAIRQEYINVQYKLNELKDFIIANKRIDDFTFALQINSNELVKLYLEYELKLNFLEALIAKYGISKNHVIDMTNGSKKDRYKLDKKTIFTVFNRDLFNEEVSEILNSDYVKNRVMSLSVISRIMTDGEKYMDFNWNNGIRFVDAQDPYYTRLNYNIDNDELYIKNFKKSIDRDEINTILKYNIDISRFGSYYQNLFQNYNHKEVIIDGTFNSQEEKLNVLETPKNYVLTKKKIDNI